MIDQLLKATREEDWRTASALLYQHWSNVCPSAYLLTKDNPWDNAVDDKKICKFYPFNWFI